MSFIIRLPFSGLTVKFLCHYVSTVHLFTLDNHNPLNACLINTGHINIYISLLRPHTVSTDRDQLGLNKMDVGIADEQALIIDF